MAIKNVQLPNGDTYDLGAKGSNVILNNYTQNSGYVSTDDDVVTAIGKIEGKSIASDDNLSSSISIVNDKTLVNSSAVYDNSLDAKKLIANRLFKTYGKPPWSTTINNTPNVQCGFDSLWLNDTGFDKKGYELIDSGMVYCNDGTVTSIDELTLDNVDGTHILQTNSNNQPIVDSGYGVQAVGYAKVRVPGNIYYSSSYEQVDIDTKRVATNSKTWTGLADFTGSSIWTDGDNIYYSNSSIQYVLDKSTSTWSTKTWTGLTNFRGPNIWTDGDNIYYSYSSTQYVLDKSTSTWSTKTWSGLTSFRGDYIWSDGTNIYYSSGSTQYVLDKSTSTWSTKTWAGLTNFSGQYIWSDGDNIYYSDSNTHRVLDKSTSTWSAKTWTGLTSFTGSNIWTDGDNIYYSNGPTQYILDKSTSTWSTKTWTGLADFTGSNIWTDGDNIYYSSGSNQYVLDKSTSTWSTKTWTGLTCFEGQCIWSDGDNIYYSYSSTQYVLDKSTSTWSTKTWTGLTSFTGSSIWIDGDNIYYSNGSKQYVLDKSTSTWSTKTWTGLTSFTGSSIWADGDNIYYSYDSTQRVLNKSTSTWSTKTWTGLTDFEGQCIWSDGDNIYYSDSSTQYVLDKSTSTWSTKTWTGLTNFRGPFLWTDGDNIYYSKGSTQYILDKSTSTWSTKTWTGLTSFDGSNIWTFEGVIFYSTNTTHYILDKSTSTWSQMYFAGSLPSFNGYDIWSDGSNTYYSSYSDQYILESEKIMEDLVIYTWSTKTWSGLTSFSGQYIWTDGDNIYYSQGSTQYVLNKSTSTWSAITWTGLSDFNGNNAWSDNITDDSVITIYSDDLGGKSSELPTSASGATMSNEQLTAISSKVQEQANWNSNYGVKNICPYNSGTASTGEGTIWNNLPIDIAAGTYSVSFSTDSTNSGLVLLAADGATEVLRKTYSTTTVNDTFTISTAAKYIRLYIGASKTVSNFMIHSFGDDTYQPYALPNSDLTTLSAEDRASLVEIVDGGAKNIADFTLTTKTTYTTSTSHGVTVTRNGDIFTISGTSDTDNNIFFNIYYDGSTSTKMIPPGNWVALIEDCTGSVVKDITVQICAPAASPKEYGVPIQFSLSGSESGNWLRINLRPSTAYDGSFRLMICTKAAWDISHAYQPYRPNVLDSKMTRKQAITNGMYLVERKPKATTNPDTGEPYIFASFADYNYDFASVEGITLTQFGIIYCNDGTARVDELRLKNVDGVHIIKKDNRSGTNLPVSGTNPVTAVGFTQYQDADGVMSDVLYTNDIGGDYRMLKAPDNIELLQALFSTCFTVVPPCHVMNGSAHGVRVNYGFKSNMNPITKLNIDFTVSEFGLIYSRDGTVSDFRNLTLDDVDGTHIIKSVGVNGQNIVDNGYGVLCVGYVVITLSDGTTFTIYTNEDIGGKASELPTTVSSPALSPAQLTSIVHDGVSHGAASANKLNTNAGSATKPVYFSGGVPVATTAPGAGAWFSSFTGNISSSGVLEVGRYLDFHSTNTGTTDYDIRLDASSTSLLTMTSSSGTPQLRLSGTLPRLRFTQTTSGKAYDNVLCGISAYPGNTAGVNLVIQSGGNTFIGGGESPASLYTRIITTDSNPYGTSSLEASEQMFITADNNIYFVSGAGSISATAYTDWTDLKTAIFDSAGSFKPSVNKKGSIGASSYQWGTAYINTVTIDNSCTLSYNSSTQSLDFIFS